MNRTKEFLRAVYLLFFLIGVDIFLFLLNIPLRIKEVIMRLKVNSAKREMRKRYIYPKSYKL